MNTTLGDVMETNNLIRILCDSYSEFKLFWDTHFEIVPYNSLVPEFDKDLNPKFDKGIQIQRKSVTAEDKLAFYEKDILLWKEIKEDEQREEGDQDG